MEWEGVEGERSESQKTYLNFCPCLWKRNGQIYYLGEDRDILGQLFNWSGAFYFPDREEMEVVMKLSIKTPLF